METYLIHDRLYRAHFPDQAAYVKASTQIAHQRLIDKMEVLGIGQEEMADSNFRGKVSGSERGYVRA